MCKTHGRNACPICEFTLTHGKVVLPPSPVEYDYAMQGFYTTNWRDRLTVGGIPADENDEVDDV